MKIDQMLLREDFYSILRSSLNDFNILSSISNNKSKIGIDYYIYPKINAFVTKYPSEEIVKYLKNEFSSYNGFMKSIISKCYMNILLCTKGKLSSHIVNIKADFEKPDSIMIYPSNRKIRIMDFSKEYSDIIMKKGFPAIMIKKEIEFRTLYREESFILPLDKTGEVSYREKILKGSSLARIGDKKNFNMYCNKVMDLKNKFENQFLESVNSKEYIEELRTKLNGYNGEDRSIIKLWFEKITDSLNDFIVPVSISHGDFQKGNVWIEENHNIIILDWETWDKRSIWYDKMIFNNRFRNSRFYIQSLKNVLNRNSNLTKKAIGIIDILKIIIIEDLIWNIEEDNSLPEDVSSFGMNFYRNENNLKDVLSILK